MEELSSDPLPEDPVPDEEVPEKSDDVVDQELADSG
jgi:hypothetical protein